MVEEMLKEIEEKVVYVEIAEKRMVEEFLRLDKEQGNVYYQETLDNTKWS